MKAVEILAKAADRIDQGWCQHLLSNEKDEVCIVGALNAVTMGHPDMWGCDKKGWWTAIQAIEKELNGVPSESMDVIVEWNNSPGRLKEEVSTTLRNAKRWL